ncbi:MAG: choice-of-anchor Q domain-containing protein [Pyrinomonadaceae bacterium]
MHYNKIKLGLYTAVIFMAASININAATFTVTNTNDSGAGSLRQAVLDANAASGSDAIVFSSLFSFPQTITLATVININSGNDADTTTITGPGSNLLTVSGNNVTPILTHFTISNPARTASISGMTLTQGNGGGVDGGAVSNDGTLTLTNMVLTGNTTSSVGGAVKNSGTLNINSSTLSTNTAFQSGGIHNNSSVGTLNITGSTITGNTSTDGAGGIGNFAGTVNITGSTISNNIALGNFLGGGGGIYNVNIMTVTNSIISGNETRTTAGNSIPGGGIANQVQGTLTITNSTITGNLAVGSGGGIFNQPNQVSGPGLTITNSTISNNIANSDSISNGEGGGLAIEGGLPINISGSTINGNSAIRGGGIDVSSNSSSTVTLTNSTISGNTATGSVGGIYNGVFSIVNATNCTITGNFGGGIFRQDNGVVNPVNLRNNIVANNSPDLTGTFNSNGFNLIEDTNGATITGITATNITGQDPNLGPLQNNGGPTFTHGLLTGSPALDQGESSGTTTDQRSQSRPYDNPIITNASGGDGADIGSVEVLPGVLSGTITYGNAIGNPAAPRLVKNVSVASTAGSPAVGPVITGTPGTYTLTGFGSGSYTIKPTKTGGPNGSITSFDAARAAQGATGGVPFVSQNQRFAADASGNGQISSLDAAKIAQYAAGLPSAPPNLSGEWRFFVTGAPSPLPTPPQNYNDSRTYASVTSNLTGEDYVGILVGEVTGNWNPATHPRPAGKVNSEQWTVNKEDGGETEKPITVTARHLVTQSEKEIVVPVSVQGVAGKEIISYEFDLRYDPTVIQPLANPVDVVRTVSRGLFVVTNAYEPGLLRVVVYGVMPIDEDGVLLNLKFAAVGAAVSGSALAIERIMFNEGDSRVIVNDGLIELSADGK